MRIVRAAAVAGFVALVSAVPASATPVCTDGYKGGPPAACAAAGSSPRRSSRAGTSSTRPTAFGFIEYQHGIEYLAQKYPRWISVFKLCDLYGDRRGQRRARTSSAPYEDGDTGDGRDIQVDQDHRPQRARRGQGDAVLLALGPRQRARRPRGRPAHGRGPRDRGRGAAARSPTASTTTTRPPGREPKFHEYEVADVLAKEAVYLVDFNVDGWAVGDWWNQPRRPPTRAATASAPTSTARCRRSAGSTRAATRSRRAR